MAFQDVMQNLQLVDIFYPPGSYYETSDQDFDPNVRWGGIWELDNSFDEVKDLLWTNTSGRKDAQTINIPSLSDYQYVEAFFYDPGYSSPDVMIGNPILVEVNGSNSVLWIHTLRGAGVNGNIGSRYVRTDAQNIYISNYQYKNRHSGGALTTDNNYAIPNRIYGIKNKRKWHRLENVTRLNLVSHGSWVDSGIEVDGHKVYKSESSYHVQNAWDTTKIIFKGFRKFQIAIRSYAEGSYDYVLVSTLNNDYLATQSSTAAMRNAYNNAEYTKAYTRSKQSATNYEIVTFDNLNKNQEYYFYVIYQKDSSQDSNDDRGYFYIITE